ncbi:hypothetical protein [Mammaliicoccus lentus]|uniref:hypothetical protein n=1 Tax=Mammaliicoccus lentus TaxID=42858 RepID=UPI002DB7A9CD|nr:hypothetical protein [Mammaliicoccus lentus]MEB8093151.1 hypothetical protein [Mammaliicoccus lentus]
MAKKINSAGSVAMLFEIYTYLKNKSRSQRENIIYKMIKDKYETQFKNSPTYYYRMNEHKAKVNVTTFYARVKRGWSLYDSLVIENKGNGHGQEKKLNETEEDIIRFLKNDLPLNPRQLKYIESNTEFAEKLKKEGIC